MQMRVATLFVCHKVYSLELTVPACCCPLCLPEKGVLWDITIGRVVVEGIPWSHMCMHKLCRCAGTNAHLFTIEEDVVRDLEDPLVPEGESLFSLPCGLESDQRSQLVCLSKPDQSYTYFSAWGNMSCLVSMHMMNAYAQQSCAPYATVFGNSSHCSGGGCGGGGGAMKAQALHSPPS